MSPEADDEEAYARRGEQASGLRRILIGKAAEEVEERYSCLHRLNAGRDLGYRWQIAAMQVYVRIRSMLGIQADEACYDTQL